MSDVKPRPVKGILIDPFSCTVTEVEKDGNQIEDTYRLLSHESMPVDCFTVVGLGYGDAIFVDDEGLLKPCDRFFIFHGYPQPLAGKGLILGSNDEGETISAKTKIEKVRKYVTFAERVTLDGKSGLLPTVTPWEAKATV